MYTILYNMFNSATHKIILYYAIVCAVDACTIAVYDTTSRSCDISWQDKRAR